MNTTFGLASVMRYIFFSFLIYLFTLPPQAAEQIRVGYIDNATPISSAITSERNTPTPQGLAIDVWQKTAAQNKWTYAYAPPFKSFTAAYSALQSNTIDVLLGPLTPQILPNVAFTNPIYATHLGIATLAPSSNVLAHIATVITEQMYMFTFWVFLAGLAIPWFVARAEKAATPFYHIYSPLKVFKMTLWSFFSIGASIDLLYPIRTRTSEILCALWVGITMVYMSILSASISSALVVSSLDNAFFKPSDFQKKRVAVIEPFHPHHTPQSLTPGKNTQSSKTYIRKMGAYISTEAQTVVEALYQLRNKEISAIIAPYWILQEDLFKKLKAKNIRISPLYFVLHLYSIGVQRDSPLLPALNEAIDTFKLTGTLDQICQKYFHGIGGQQCLI